MRLSPEEMLIRWVNYHLARSDCGRRIANFTSDIQDSIAYIHLIHQISPRDAGVTTAAEHVSKQELSFCCRRHKVTWCHGDGEYDYYGDDDDDDEDYDDSEDHSASANYHPEVYHQIYVKWT